MAEGDTKRVTFEVTEAIPLDGLTLTPGVYLGKRVRTWIGYDYSIELTGDDLKALTGRKSKRTTELYVDVTRLVRVEKIRVF